MSLYNLFGKKILYFDGAMGTMLQQKSIKLGQRPELININDPNAVLDIHKQYLEAGADVLTTNTFGVNRFKYDDDNLIREIIKSAIKITRTAINDTCSKNKFVAFDIGSFGKLLEPLGTLSFEDAYDAYKYICIQAQNYGADLILIETMMDLYEAKACILAAKENTNLPVFCTMTFEKNNRTLTGADVKTVVAVLEGLNVDCLGINCSLGPASLLPLVKSIIKYSSIPVLVQPNAGIPEVIAGKTIYNSDPKEYGIQMKDFADMGVWAIGGCCGTTPTHIQSMVEATCDLIPKPLVNKQLTIVSSYSDSVIIGGAPVVIGERINPTGKKKLKNALLAEDYSYLINEAQLQIEADADILDINVGLPEIDEEKIMVATVKSVQSISRLPLQIDSSNIQVIEKALRIYNGKALINSVNGKKEVMEQLFPIAKKYGGVIVGLALDEDGIPETADKRVRIAEKIITTAASYGIHKKDIIIDTLTLTVGAQQSEAVETLKAVKMVKEQLGVKTVLGVSNISFGLPQRINLNSVFLAMACYNGLDACIINPCTSEMMNVIRSFNVLIGHDVNAYNYISHYSNNIVAKVEQSQINTLDEEKLFLTEIITKGNKDLAYDITMKLLSHVAPLDIINTILVPALAEIGRGYESYKIFLPQLMLSAETAKYAFDAIKVYMEKEGVFHESKGKIILATVKGDIHDIGKNIVKVLLENYGYDVIDLGRDVDSSLIIQTAIDNDIKLIGLSALMTSTVDSMESTIKEIRQNGLSCKIAVGGAVLNKEYAKIIGADFYGKDAMAAVAIAEEVFSH